MNAHVCGQSQKIVARDKILWVSTENQFHLQSQNPQKITFQSYLDGIKPTLYFLQNISCNTIASNINFDLRKTLLHQLSPNYQTSLSTESWMHRKRASLVLFYHPYIIKLWQSKWNKSELKVQCDEKPSQSCSMSLKNVFVCIEKCTDSCLE